MNAYSSPHIVLPSSCIYHMETAGVRSMVMHQAATPQQEEIQDPKTPSQRVRRGCWNRCGRVRLGFCQRVYVHEWHACAHHEAA